jgi:hypothetical protein
MNGIDIFLGSGIMLSLGLLTERRRRAYEQQYSKK